MTYQILKVGEVVLVPHLQCDVGRLLIGAPVHLRLLEPLGRQCPLCVSELM